MSRSARGGKSLQQEIAEADVENNADIQAHEEGVVLRIGLFLTMWLPALLILAIRSVAQLVLTCSATTGSTSIAETTLHGRSALTLSNGSPRT